MQHKSQTLLFKLFAKLMELGKTQSNHDFNEMLRVQHIKPEDTGYIKLFLSKDILTLKIANISIKIGQIYHYGSIVSLSSCFMF